MTLQTIVFVLGMILGAILIVAVAVRYWKQGNAGIGAAGLALIGMLCIGLSLWTSIEVEAGDVKVRLKSLAEQLDAVTEEVTKASESQEQARAQILQLAHQIQTAPTGTQPDLRNVTRNLENIRPVDVERLAKVRRELRVIR